MVRRYEGVDQAAADEVMRRVDEGFVPIISQVPGFVAYYALEAGSRLFASVTIAEDRAGIEESNRLAAEYVQKHLFDRFPTAPEITAGGIRASRVA